MTTVLVTGANRGIGFEFVRQYANDGARVVACARRPNDAKELLDLAAAASGRVAVHELDAASAESVANLAAELALQPIDILINNAGVYGGTHQQPGDIDYDAWMRTLSVNTLGPVRVTEALRPNLTKGREKKIVAITSGMGSTAEHDGTALIYRSSKAALNNAMRGLALRLKADGMTVVLIHPGWVKTHMGGKNATLTPEVSVSAMRRVVSSLSPSDNGRYINYAGAEIPW
jgi:NAD(P)-dependent dehydrogenase (short-subunit alcohol dehydrogenase family)